MKPQTKIKTVLRRTEAKFAGEISISQKLKLKGEHSYEPVLTDSNGGVFGLVDRIKVLCDEHSVSLTELPKFFSQITYADCSSDDKLLNALTPDIVQTIADTFGVQAEWLIGTSDKIYDIFSCYKDARVLFDFLNQNRKTLGYFPLHIVASKDAFDRETSGNDIALVVKLRLNHPAAGEHCRYVVCGDGWKWSHLPCRLQLKAMARLLYFSPANITIPIHITSRKTVLAIYDGKMIPHQFLQQSPLRVRLEDYALDAEESLNARETGEVAAVKRLSASEAYRLEGGVA